MRLKISLISLFFLTLFFGFFSAKTALADSYTLSGKVSDSSGNAISGASVSVIDTNTNNNVADTTSDASGNYSVSVNGGIYNVQVTPPSGSNFTSAIAPNHTISANTIINFILVSAGSASLSGHVYDPLGNPVSNQKVMLLVSGSLVTSADTDASGSYSMQVSPGTYRLDVAADNNSNLLNVPQNYDIFTSSYSLTQSTVLDVTIPVKKVSFHIQDSTGSPVSGVVINSQPTNLVNINGLSMGGGITNASGISNYNSGPATDSSGNATLWLFPNNSNLSYSFTATPPSGSIYSIFVLNNISVTSDQTEVLSLQYSHDPPVTTANLSPTQLADGTYSDPVTVTLQATAISGYTVANIYYTVDNGSQQTYSLPFTVSGDGSHTITYWSIDNSGVQESHNTKTFTIHTDEPPDVNSLSNATINKSDTYTANGSFTDPDSTSWTATVNYGDGSGTNNLVLDGTNFTLNHTYTVAGVFSIEIKVTDNQGAVGTKIVTVNVNTPPQINPLSDGAVNLQDEFIENGSFTDPDSIAWFAAADYGDGSGVQLLTLTGKNFTLDYTYQATGEYAVTVYITDNQGATSTAQLRVIVNGSPQINSLPSVTTNEGDTYSANGSFTDSDSTSWTATVNYGDASGTQNLTLNGTNFTLSHVYKDNGIYTVSVVVTDNKGAIGTGNATVTVNNIAPADGIITVATSPVQVNTAIIASASFSDPGILDTHTASWNWGDGNTTAGTVTESNGSGSISNAHSYSAAGVYTITLTVTDKDGGSGTATYQFVAVYNPNAGFLTGSGKYNSIAGWYSQNPQAEGEVKFGVSAQYETGSNVPTGQTKVKFKIGDLDFSGNTFQWLVVSGPKAIVQGNGTINGIGNYIILISGIDGSQTGGQNLIRVMITDSSNNVIYDTQPGDSTTADPTTSLTSGHIKVH